MKTVKHVEVAKPLTKEGSYVDVKLHPDSKLAIAKLVNHLSKFGYEQEPGVFPMTELHCTVMYSTSTIDAEAAKTVFNPANKYEATITGCDVFGPKNDTLVLLLDAPELTELHNRLLGLGATPTFPDYKAHITIQKPVTAKFKERLEKFLKDQEEPIVVQLYRERMSALASVGYPTVDFSYLETAATPK